MTAPTHSQLRRAVELWRNDLAPKQVWRANARRWLAANAWLGNKHILKGGEIRWGVQLREGV